MAHANAIPAEVDVPGAEARPERDSPQVDLRAALNRSLKPETVLLLGAVTPSFAEILTPEALAFLAALTREFTPARDALLRRRVERQRRFDAGLLPDFLPQTEHVRTKSWSIPPVPPDLRDRRVEITGPTDRKMIINALNSGARAYMADFEDSHSPTWEGTVQGQINLRDAVDRSITFVSADGKEYALKDEVATLLVRPRGWHLDERHVIVDWEPMPASLFDFALYMFHNAHALRRRGSGPYFYLPKLESHLEARLWNDVFVRAEELLGLPRGTIRATVLIETLPAAFETHEILYELREHAAGLNSGRWDYLFSFIKTFRRRAQVVFPDRSDLTMTRPSLDAYSRLVVQTCHAHGAHAIGGMAPQIPNKNDPAANAAALEKVVADKQREVGQGYDGTWVAHPGLVPVAEAVFNEAMPGPNQLDLVPDTRAVAAADLLEVPDGPITEAGIRTNIRVALEYLESWLRGVGCVPIRGLMEDAATVEISRAQLWQWIHHAIRMEDGRDITVPLFRGFLSEELDKICAAGGTSAFAASQYPLSAQILDRVVTHGELIDFLTPLAYEYLPEAAGG